jgi:MraZ protein
VASFRGSFLNTLDLKGRLTLAPPIRRVTGVKEKGGPEPYLILTKGLNGCLWAFTEDEWSRLEAKLKLKQFQDQESRDFVLEMMSNVQDVSIDSAARILIPQSYLQLAGLERGGEVKVLGMMDHVELWLPKRYDEHVARARQKTSYEENSRELLRN